MFRKREWGRLARAGLAAGVGAAWTVIAVGAPATAQVSDPLPENELVVRHLVEDKNLPVTYDYIATLMRLPNAFGDGAACIICHTSNDPRRSYRGLDLSTCEGIRRGATEAPARPVVVPGDAAASLIARRLTHNRMPFGVPFDAPTDTPNIRLVQQWIDDGAKDDAMFRDSIQPLLRDAAAFGGDRACTDCHMSNQDPPSFQELDLTSHAGIMNGALPTRFAAAGKPGRAIVVPGDAAASPLYQRLTENRMPAGIDPAESRDHPNAYLLLRWIDQGAMCD